MRRSISDSDLNYADKLGTPSLGSIGENHNGVFGHEHIFARKGSQFEDCNPMSSSASQSGSFAGSFEIDPMSMKADLDDLEDTGRLSIFVDETIFDKPDENFVGSNPMAAKKDKALP